jgi:hypothetical protein
LAAKMSTLIGLNQYRTNYRSARPRSLMGQSRKLVAATAGPAFPSETDIIGQVRHVPKVPILLQKSVAPMGGRPFHYEWPALIGRR